MTSSSTDASTGYGEDLTPDDQRWQAAAAELTPERSLARIGTNARASVTTVALLGTVLTGLGLVAVPTLLGDDVSRWLAVAAVATAMLAVVSGLLYLALRLEQLNISDLGLVEQWYWRQFRRARLAVAASWLLVAAVLLGGAAALANVIASVGSGPEPGLSLQVAGAGPDRTVGVQVAIAGLDTGSVVHVRVLGHTAACPDTVLLQGASRADSTGKVAFTTTITEPCHDEISLEVAGGGVKARSVAVP